MTMKECTDSSYSMGINPPDVVLASPVSTETFITITDYLSFTDTTNCISSYCFLYTGCSSGSTVTMSYYPEGRLDLTTDSSKKMSITDTSKNYTDVRIGCRWTHGTAYS